MARRKRRACGSEFEGISYLAPTRAGTHSAASREQLSAARAGRNLQTQIRKALSNGFTGDNSHGGKYGSEGNEDIKGQISMPGVAVSMPGVAGRFGSQSESLRRPRASQR